MSAVSRMAQSDSAESGPRFRLHGFRLDYNAALAAIARGACAAQVAIAAGSKATSRRNLRRVGLKLIHRLVDSGQVQDVFDQLGYTIEHFCQGVIDATQATRMIYFHYRGEVTDAREVPDWRARHKASGQYMQATGIDRWPVLEERVVKVIESRSDDDWVLLVALSSEELACLVELAVETAAARRRRRAARHQDRVG